MATYTSGKENFGLKLGKSAYLSHGTPGEINKTNTKTSISVE